MSLSGTILQVSDKLHGNLGQMVLFLRKGSVLWQYWSQYQPCLCCTGRMRVSAVGTPNFCEQWDLVKQMRAVGTKGNL